MREGWGTEGVRGGELPTAAEAPDKECGKKIRNVQEGSARERCEREGG